MATSWPHTHGFLPCQATASSEPAQQGDHRNFSQRVMGGTSTSTDINCPLEKCGKVWKNQPLSPDINCPFKKSTVQVGSKQPSCGSLVGVLRFQPPARTCCRIVSARSGPSIANWRRKSSGKTPVRQATHQKDAFVNHPKHQGMETSWNMKPHI